VAERGAATLALLAIVRDVADDRALAGLICRACVVGLDVDGAALSLLTASVARHTLHATDPTARLLEELQFSLNEGACIEAATTVRVRPHVQGRVRPHVQRYGGLAIPWNRRDFG
jgi:hypothetical protein